MEYETALDAFVAAIGKINDRLDELKAYAEKHMNCEPETITWGHVGSAYRLLTAITDLTDQAYNRGEYAE